MSVKPIPDGFHSVTPYLIVRDVAAALDFYHKAFGATENYRLTGPGGLVVHAEFTIGNSRLMVGGECPSGGSKSPATLGGSSLGLAIYVENVDALFHQALAAGCTENRPLQNQFYGDRSGTVTDPFGHVWTLGTHVEDVTLEECQRRCDALMKQMSAAA